MGKSVITIPATVSRYTAVPINSSRKRRTAGYARVSTDHEDQQTSYEAQVDYYSAYIQSREDWEFVAVYTDEGISATSTTKRDGFNRMVADALDGRIDKTIIRLIQKHDNESAVKPPFLGGFLHFWGLGSLIEAYSKAQAARFSHGTL